MKNKQILKMKQLSKTAVFFLLLVCVAISSCNDKPQNVLSQKKLVNVITDLHLMDVAFNEKKISILEYQKREAYKQSVFEKHKITSSDFDSSLVWYSNHPEKLELVYNEVVERLQEMNAETNQVEIKTDKK